MSRLSKKISRRPPRVNFSIHGGAGSARPQGGDGFDRGMCPVGQPASRLALPVDEIPGLRLARIRGRGDRVPPRKSPSHHLRAFHRKAILAWKVPPRRGGLRTPASETPLSPGDRPIRPPGVPLPSMIMLCLGLRTASQCGRGDRAPPRKQPFALSPGFPR